MEYRIEIWHDDLGGRYASPREEHAETFAEAQRIATAHIGARIIRNSDDLMWCPAIGGGDWSRRP